MPQPGPLHTSCSSAPLARFTRGQGSNTFLSMLNHASHSLCLQAVDRAETLRIAVSRPGGSLLIDAGAEITGSLQAGLLMANVCFGGAAEVAVTTEDADRLASDIGVLVRTDDPLRACLGAQYAGWPVSVEKYFAMASGPMRMARGREDMLLELGLRETPQRAAGVLESDRLPELSVIESIAQQCGVAVDQLALIVAPSGSLAGSVQVIARSIETAMHKLHALGFDVRTIFSAAGIAPLAPPARPADTIGGIGRTNDAILYGGRVTLWVDCEQTAIDAVAEAVPSNASKDHGRPFAEIFKDYDYDFYKVDPHLFSPAVVTLINRRSGQTRRFGGIQSDILRASFGA